MITIIRSADARTLNEIATSHPAVLAVIEWKNVKKGENKLKVSSCAVPDAEVYRRRMMMSSRSWSVRV